MLIKVEGKDETIKKLEEAQKLITKAEALLWRLPSEIKMVIQDDSPEITDSTHDDPTSNYVKELMKHPEKHSSQEMANLPRLLELCQKETEQHPFL